MKIRVNGKLCDGSITIKLGEKEYYGFTEISYGEVLEAHRQHEGQPKLRRQ